MPRLSSLALVLVVLAAAPLAGCVGAPQEAEGDAPRTNESAPQDLTAPDGRGEIAGFEETNRTEPGLGGMSHDHDYWKGRDRVELHQGNYAFVPIPLAPDGYPVASANGDLRPTPPNLVFEGTAFVEVLVSELSVFGAPHPLATMRVHYITAADDGSAWRDGGVARQGEPLLIPVEPLQTDMPHASSSLWMFRMFTEEPGYAQVNVTLTAVRGAPVVDWPPHPDFYANGPERVVLDADVTTEERGALVSGVYGESGGWARPERPVSYGTREMEVTVTLRSVDAPTKPLEYVLEVHNATYLAAPGGNPSQYTQRHEPVRVDDDSLSFLVPADAYGFDSPYASASRWGLRLKAVYGADESCAPSWLFPTLMSGGCVPYRLTYHVKAVARGEPAS